MNEPACVFLTVSTMRRAPWLASPKAQELLEATWREADAWLVTDYLLMPDHLHCFCFPKDKSKTIERWISFWKDRFRKRHQNPAWRFQSRGWHHRLRDSEDYSEKWRYVQMNPVRGKLVTNSDEWTFKGRVHTVQFRVGE